MQTKVAELRTAAAAGSEASLPRGGAVRARRRGTDLAKRLLVIANDAIALVASHWIAEAGVQRWLRVSRSALEPGKYLLFYLPFLLVVLYLFGRKQSLEVRRPEKELELVVKGVSLSFASLVCANFVFFKGLGFSRYLMLTWYLLALCCLLGVRFGLRGLYAKLWKRGLAQRRTLLIGSPEKLSKLQEALAIQRFQGYELIGIIPAGGDESSDGLGVLGPFERWEEIARQNAVEQVVVCLAAVSEEAHRLVSDILRGCLAAGIDVQIHSDLFASREFNSELDDFSGFFRFYAAPRWSRQVQRLMKVVMDRVIGLVGSLVTLFITPFVALIIKLDDGGPVFYQREFVGCDGQIHYYLKFRTMHPQAGEILRNNTELKAKFDKSYKLAEDPRVSRVGRFLRKYSIDEFPQFFSLVRGQLTFVGPRVISSEEKQRYGPLLPRLLSCKPGITGFWQVMGRQTTTYEERVRMDMFYIDHWSIWLDLQIIGKTFWKVLRAEGAC
jgi:exopolysaccharide biosynthesis polyprenyl glycosylphosphotransferase